MAYISQQEKKVIATALKAAMVKFPTVKYSLSIRNHSTIVCTISKGPASLTPKDGVSSSPNIYHLESHYEGEALEIYQTILQCLSIGHFDKSDVQSDYFHCAFYRDINVGSYDKPFQVV